VNNTYTKEKTSRIQVKLIKDDDLERKDKLDALSLKIGESASSLVITELELMIRENKQ
jgi:hypothetical protein